MINSLKNSSRVYILLCFDNEKDLTFVDYRTRLKVLMKSMSTEQSSRKSYHLINEDHSIRVTNLCTDSQMNSTHVAYVCLSNSIGDGPLSFAYYFHIRSPAPIYASIRSLNSTVLSSREISIHWNIQQILTSISYRIRWIARDKPNEERTIIASHNETNVVLDNLIPFTFYKIMINTFNINGDGPVREADLVRTYEDGM